MQVHTQPFTEVFFINTNFSPGNHELERASSNLVLGVLLNPKLNFNSHICKAVNKVTFVVLSNNRSPYVTKQLYTSLVNLFQDMRRLYGIQCILHQAILLNQCKLNFYYYASAVFILIRLIFHGITVVQHWATLKSRRSMLIVTFILNLINFSYWGIYG